MVGESPVTCSGSDTISSPLLSPYGDGKEWKAERSRRAHSQKNSWAAAFGREAATVGRNHSDIGIRGAGKEEKTEQEAVVWPRPKNT